MPNSCPTPTDEKSSQQIDTSEKLMKTDQELFLASNPGNNPAIRRNN